MLQNLMLHNDLKGGFKVSRKITEPPASHIKFTLNKPNKKIKKKVAIRLRNLTELIALTL